MGDVEKGGPADRAGLVSGDVITAVDTANVPHAQDLPRLVARHAPGSHVKLTVMHDKSSKTVDVTLAQLQDPKARPGRRRFARLLGGADDAGGERRNRSPAGNRS